MLNSKGIRGPIDGELGTRPDLSGKAEEEEDD
jgi:hypothetical protein